MAARRPQLLEVGAQAALSGLVLYSAALDLWPARARDSAISAAPAARALCVLVASHAVSALAGFDGAAAAAAVEGAMGAPLRSTLELARWVLARAHQRAAYAALAKTAQMAGVCVGFARVLADELLDAEQSADERAERPTAGAPRQKRD